MSKTLTFDFCSVTVCKRYMVVVIFAGTHITPEHNSVLENIVDSYFKDQPFVYLTHRKNSYSVDPAIYVKTSKIKNLAGFGVIAEKPVSRANAAVEKLFLNKPFEIFDNLEDARIWAKHILDSDS